jgi:hypothetical protein
LCSQTAEALHTRGSPYKNPELRNLQFVHQLV